MNFYFLFVKKKNIYIYFFFFSAVFCKNGFTIISFVFVFLFNSIHLAIIIFIHKSLIFLHNNLNIIKRVIHLKLLYFIILIIIKYRIYRQILTNFPHRLLMTQRNPSGSFIRLKSNIPRCLFLNLCTFFRRSVSLFLLLLEYERFLHFIFT